MPNPPKVLKPASSLADGWGKFKAALEAAGGPMSGQVEKFAQDAYYVGAATIWDIVMQAPEMDPRDPDDSRGEMLRAQLQAELEGYVGARVSVIFPFRG